MKLVEVRIYTKQGGGGLITESFHSRVQAEAFAQNWASTVGQYLPYQYSGFKYLVDIVEPYDYDVGAVDGLLIG